MLLLLTVQKAGFSALAIVPAAMLLVSGVVGIVFAPRTQGRDLADTGAEEVRTRSAERDLQAA
ncbi:MAG TPA: hypothetical protein VHW04_03655 [Solirubrobacteraceae bacterium]|nr:hypothetical protein [Solirubrobacteraceae bacterium]